MAESGYIVEFQSIGALVRVTAIDPVSGREVVIQGPASAGQQALARAAVKKLEYMLQQKHGDGSH